MSVFVIPVIITQHKLFYFFLTISRNLSTILEFQVCMRIVLTWILFSNLKKCLCFCFPIMLANLKKCLHFFKCSKIEKLSCFQENVDKFDKLFVFLKNIYSFRKMSTILTVLKIWKIFTISKYFSKKKVQKFEKKSRFQKKFKFWKTFWIFKIILVSKNILEIEKTH